MSIDSLLLNWLLPSSIVSMGLLAFALASIPLLRRSSAAIRHFVLTVAFVGSALVLISLMMPSWSWRILEPASPEPTRPASLFSVGISAGAPLIPPEPSAPVPVRATRFGAQRAMIALLWFAGAAYVMARLAAGLSALHKASRRSSACPVPSLAGTRASIRLSDEVEVPVTWGWLRPVILLPPKFLEWTPDMRRLALLHEAAHVRRLDWLVFILAQIVCAFFWFNPVAWIALRVLQAEQEKAADDLVLSAAPARAYATALIDLAQCLQLRSEALPAVPILRGGSLENRVRSLMDPTVSRRLPGSTQLLGASSFLVLLCLCFIVRLTAREPSAEPLARKLSEAEQRLVGQWRGGGMLPSTVHFKDDGTYELQAFGATNTIRGIWKVEGDLLTYTTTSPTNFPPKTRRLLQVSSNFYQWQFVGEESQNIFGYHRLTNIQLGTIAGVALRRGRPLIASEVLLEPFAPDGKPLPRTETKTDREGRFAFHGLAPGLYKVSRMINWDSFNDQATSHTAAWTHAQIVHLEKDKTKELTLGRGRTIRGEFVPPPGFGKEQLAFTAGDFRFLTPAQRRADGIPTVYVLEIESNGTFTVPDLPAGQYNLYATFRAMTGQLDSAPIASASQQITVLPEPGDQDVGQVLLTALGGR